MNTAVAYPKWRTAYDTYRWHMENDTPHCGTAMNAWNSYVLRNKEELLSSLSGCSLLVSKQSQFKPSDFKLLTRDKWLHKLIKAAHDALENPADTTTWYPQLKEAYTEYCLS